MIRKMIIGEILSYACFESGLLSSPAAQESLPNSERGFPYWARGSKVAPKELLRMTGISTLRKLLGKLAPSTKVPWVDIR